MKRPAVCTTFYNRLIEGLLAVQHRKSDDNVYGWFEVMCRFCAGKPLVYCSRYRRGPRLFAIAHALHVKMVWSPLQKVPQGSYRGYVPHNARHQRQREAPSAACCCSAEL